MSALADDIELFFGDANPAETRVYARLSVADRQPDMRLSGSLTGPFCRYAKTLPATIPLVDRGPGPSLLAQAVVPDPCFWSPELPYLYQAHIELRSSNHVLGTIERPLGIRPLGAHGRRFYFEGKPWVLRGVWARRIGEAELDAFHAADAALYVDHPSDELCAAASQVGVLIVAGTTGEPESIRRLARHASVGFIAMTRHPAPNARSLAPNAIFVERCDQPPAIPAPWASTVMCRELDRLSETELPVIAFRAEAEGGSVAVRRAYCDVLQRDLAGGGEVAGYLV